MPRRARVKSRSGIYHIILKGANSQEIFHEDKDCLYFLDILQKYKEQTNLKVYGWCLMSNHVHLLIREGDEDVSITMKRMEVSFVYYYNWKYQTTGHLFQDRFKSKNVEDAGYLLRVIRYIHQNPLKAGIAKCVEEWRWSSCRGYYGLGSEHLDLLDDGFILNRFGESINLARERFKEFNERPNEDQSFEEQMMVRRRMTDEEAREEIRNVLEGIEIAQVKSLPKLKRNEVLLKVKEIDSVSQRQAARILGVSRTLISRSQGDGSCGSSNNVVRS